MTGVQTCALPIYLDEDQLEELAEIIEDETGEYVSADMIETNSVIEKLAKAIEEF